MTLPNNPTAQGWQEGLLLVIAIDISLTLIPIIRIVYDEFKELVMIRVGAKAMGLKGKDDIVANTPADAQLDTSNAVESRSPVSRN